MKKYKYVLFDLDGTLTDSEPGILACLKHSLAYFGITGESDEKLRRMIGPPLGQSFMELYGFDEETALVALEKYRERYTVTGIYENKVYSGISELLPRLQTAGFVLILATSKPEVFAVRVIQHFGLDKYFSFISAGDLEQKHSEKVDIIRKALAVNNITELSEAVMIGDRKFDINGASLCGIDSIGVLYGYGDRDELEAAGATYIAQNVEDIESLLL
ncbi:MAG: phosphoglycolate phosphatase [Firmicutes bacterium HGW-Firmicutes-21]|nr:MAG: phosphoglycolate phosphatase [Firmicutes bacterium HGW-Firmicutes-21]